MFSVKSSQPDRTLTPFIARYVQRDSNLCGSEIVEPVIARLGTMLEFMFAEPYEIPVEAGGPARRCELVTLIGPITERRVKLVIRGHLDALVVLFRPLGLYRFFQTPVSLLAEGGTEAHSVLGPSVSALYEELGNTPDFAGRKELLDGFFVKRLSDCGALKPQGRALGLLLSLDRQMTVLETANKAGTSVRQLERAAMEYAGTSPKMLTRVSRFQQAVRLRAQNRLTWMNVAHECHYHDQMHMIRDFRQFAGGNPTVVERQITPEHLISLFYVWITR